MGITYYQVHDTPRFGAAAYLLASQPLEPQLEHGPMHRPTLELHGEVVLVRHLDAHQQVSLQKLQACCRNAFIHFLDLLTELCEADLINDWLRTAKDNSMLELV